MNDRPIAIVLFGATGDLVRGELFTGLFDLFVRGCLPETFLLLGVSQTKHTTEQYCHVLREIIEQNNSKYTTEDIDIFLSHVKYISGDVARSQTHQQVREVLCDFDLTQNTNSDWVLYLTTPKDLCCSICNAIVASGLARKRKGVATRIAFEKSFDKDVSSAKAFDVELARLFTEDQIFRIDHHPTKETLGHILGFRFSNTLFEPAWNNKFIERIEITLREKELVGAQGASYDPVGALGDLAENQALQMLAYITMERPDSFSACDIRHERAKLLNELKLPKKSTIHEQMIKGQYVGYQEEKGVTKDSRTGTYFRIVAEIDNSRWRDVPIIIEGGKGLDENETAVRVFFKEGESHSFKTSHSDTIVKNVITFSIKPTIGIALRFFASKIGYQDIVEPQTFSFADGRVANESDLNEYQKLLHALLKGDQTIFRSSEETEASWRFLSPIFREWEGTDPLPYDVGSNGPYITHKQ